MEMVVIYSAMKRGSVRSTKVQKQLLYLPASVSNLGCGLSSGE